MTIIRNHAIGNCIEDFKISEKIGSGGFANVYKAKCLRQGYDDTYVAIKRISQKIVKDRNLHSRIESEINIHSKLIHPAIVKFYTSFEDKDYIYLVLELCERGSLAEYIKHNGQFPEEKAWVLIRKIIGGIQYLHSRDISHRDLSLKNILLTNDMHVKIADFGLAYAKKYPEEQMHTMLGTPNYMPPEVVKKERYDSKADCWGVGCVLYALLYGTPPFDGKGKKYTEIMNAVVTSCLTFPNYASEEAKHLLSCMLEKDPSKRIDLTEALKHPFFKKYAASSSTKSKYSERNGDSGVSSSSSAALSGTDWKGKNRHSNSVPHNLHKLCSESSTGCHSSSGGALERSYELEDYLPRRRRQRSRSPKHQRSYENSRPVNQLKNKIQCLPSRQDMRQVIPSHPNSSYSNSSLRPVEGRLERQQMYHNEQYVNPCTVTTYPQTYSNDVSESQFHIRNRSKSPDPYPVRLQDICDEHCSQSHYSIHNSVDPNMHNGTVYRNNNQMPPTNYPDYPSTYSSCSHAEYCAPEKACSHDMRCWCHCRAATEAKCNSCHSYNSCGNRNGVDLILQKSLEVKKSLKNVIDPLSTKRLTPKRLAIKSLVASILDDGEVCFEILKSKRNEKYITEVFRVSGDGLTIRVYKPKKYTQPTNEPCHPKTMQDVQYFTFENLPEKHWNKYHQAKRFVEIVRAKTPKVTVFGEQAKCIMMENTPNPDYDVQFYDGFEIFQDAKKWTFIDKKGEKTYFTNEDHLRQHFAKNNLTWEDFINVKKKCERLGEMWAKLEENESESIFPVTIGRKPNGSHDFGKENMTRSLGSSTLNRALNG